MIVASHHNQQGRFLENTEKQFLLNLVDALTERQISHIFLRNYEEFPDRIGHDLDLFLKRDDVEEARRLFVSKLQINNGSVIHYLKMDYVESIWFRVSPDPEHWLHIDLFHGAFHWRGLSYLDTNKIFSAQTIQFGLPVLRPAHEALNLFLTTILAAAHLKVRYVPRIHSLLASKEEAIELANCLSNAFGQVEIPCLDDNASSQKKRIWRNFAYKLRLLLVTKSLRSIPITSLKGIVRYWRFELGSLLKPSGLSLVILGVDHSRRLEIAKLLTEKLGYPLFGEGRIYDSSPEFLCPSSHCNPSRDSSNSPGISDRCGETLRRAIDFWIGYFPRVWWRIAHNYLVIFNDHYFLNRLLGDEATTGKGFLPGLIGKLIPKPDMIYILQNSDTFSGNAKSVSGDRKTLIRPLSNTATVEDNVETITADIMNVLASRLPAEMRP